MKELIEQTKESKSTILYYIKEGLLPEPQKPKPNLHLYPQESINIIKFIKYLQSLNYTINDIKELFKSVPLNKDSSFLMMVKALELATISKNSTLLTKDEFLKECDISEDELEEFIDRGYIIEHNSKFGKNEVEIVKIIKNAKELNLDSKLIDRYVKSAKKIAKKEIEIWRELFSDSSQDTIKEYELLFDFILKLKPYIYNTHTVEQYYKAKGLK
jgi:DNA-binding transcriptional MerR regulator